MRIGQFLPSIQDEASGPSYSVPMLCSALGRNGGEVELFVTKAADLQYDFDVHVHPAVPIVPTMCIAPSMRRALHARRDEFDIMHTHGLWTLTSSYPHHLSPKGKRPFVVNAPRGTMSEWAMQRSKWKKRAMWWAFQSRALSNVDCFHATSEKEKAEIRRLGYKQPVALIPNGIDVLPKRQLAPSPGPRRVLFLGRVHPVKGLDILLHCWRELQDRFEDWELVICGPGEPKHVAETKKLAKDLCVERVDFCDGVYGDEKNRMYQSADLYVLPSHTENYGMTVAESLAAGVPVITTTGTPWLDLAERGCGWTVELCQPTLREAMQSAMSEPEESLLSMGHAGQNWMDEAFSWNFIGQKTLSVYQWLLGESPRPDIVG